MFIELQLQARGGIIAFGSPFERDGLVAPKGQVPSRES